MNCIYGGEPMNQARTIQLPHPVARRLIFHRPQAHDQSHSLRHTYITMMAQLGVPLPVTRDAVGHMSDSVTRHYTHIHEKVARAAVEKLERFRNTPTLWMFLWMYQKSRNLTC